ncbi:MAG: hypothetical protein ACK5NN_13015 [Sphingomonadaceae bacterium]
MNFRLPLFAIPCLALAGCSQTPAPAPSPAPVTQRTVTRPVAPPPPVPENWMDAPRTAGDWSYRISGASSAALYSQPGQAPVFAVQCDRGNRSITFMRAGSRGNSQPMRILTETTQRMVNGAPSSNGSSLNASISATDPLLDAMLFSKGRFAIEVPGEQTLYLPSWTEVSRVVEDCR